MWAQHVSGEMSTGQRTISLERLRHLDGDAVGLLANARCLAEGVDLVTIQAAMGHSALATTSRYLHARPAADQAEMFTRAFQSDESLRRPGLVADAT